MKTWQKVALGLGALLILGKITGGPDGPGTNSNSYGYMPAGQCMSADTFNKRALDWVSNANWSQVEGSATWSRSTKLMAASTQVMDDMYNLGTQACPDLNPIYQQYIATKVTRPPGR